MPIGETSFEVIPFQVRNLISQRCWRNRWTRWTIGRIAAYSARRSLLLPFVKHLLRFCHRQMWRETYHTFGPCVDGYCAMCRTSFVAGNSWMDMMCMDMASTIPALLRKSSSRNRWRLNGMWRIATLGKIRSFKRLWNVRKQREIKSDISYDWERFSIGRRNILRWVRFVCRPTNPALHSINRYFSLQNLLQASIRLFEANLTYRNESMINRQ